MATATKKGSKNTKAKPRRAVVKTSLAEQAQTIAELRQQLAESLLREKAKDKKLQERDRQLAEALEHQTATSEVLRVIASSPSRVIAASRASCSNAITCSSTNRKTFPICQSEL